MVDAAFEKAFLLHFHTGGMPHLIWNLPCSVYTSTKHQVRMLFLQGRCSIWILVYTDLTDLLNPKLKRLAKKNFFNQATALVTFSAKQFILNALRKSAQIL